jgi:hypothetical protein
VAQSWSISSARPAGSSKAASSFRKIYPGQRTATAVKRAPGPTATPASDREVSLSRANEPLQCRAFDLPFSSAFLSSSPSGPSSAFSASFAIRWICPDFPFMNLRGESCLALGRNFFADLGDFGHCDASASVKNEMTLPERGRAQRRLCFETRAGSRNRPSVSRAEKPGKETPNA